MFKFIQEALTELEHVVWPTPNETKKYMTYTVGVIIILATLLAMLGYGIRYTLSGVRSSGIFPHEAIQTTVSGEDIATQEDLNNLLDSIEKNKSSSGTTASGVTTESTQTASGN